jgi:uncharacterized protein (TIGR03435 family)
MKSITACLILASSMGFCQSAGPAFEVASVKRVVLPPGTVGWISGPARPQISGNRVAFSSVTLRALVLFAYNVTEKQISNAKGVERPGDFYDITAVAPGDAPLGADQLRLMVRSLLADRFQLKMLRETAMLPVYDLVVAKNGSKLRPSAADSQPSLQNKNGVAAGDRNYDMRLEYIHQPVSVLVGLLSSFVGDRVVLDKTSLTGTYDFTLEFSMDPADRSGSGMVTAVQEQLGLRLEQAQEPMEMLVIESVQSPSEN